MLHIPNLGRSIRSDDFEMPSDIHTNAQLIELANSLLRPHPSKAVEIYMLCDVVQCLITFAACAYVLVKKGRLHNVRIFTLRTSPHGTFIVPNAICVLLTGVCVYLLSWAGFCSWIVWVQKTDHPLFEWLWFIPYPWLPLALCAFYSAYGFVITCSPRSPLSTLGISRRSGSNNEELSWLYLPIPRSALLMNTFMVSVGAFMLVYNTVVQSLNGAQRNLTHQRGHNVYKDVLTKQHTPEWLTQAPTKELLDMMHVAFVDGLNVYRYCCLALLSYMVLIVIILGMLILYSVPNQIFLMNHLCRIYPDGAPEGCDGGGVLANVRMLRRIGWPRNLKGSTYAAFKRTWMMTIVGHSQAVLLIGGVVAFAVPPYFLFFVPWTNAFQGKSSDHQIMFIVAYTITVAFISAGWVTGLAATLTFDDIFRAVSGLGNAQTETGSGQSSSTHRHTRKPTCDKRSTIGPSRTSTSCDPSANLLRPMQSFAPSSIGSTAGEKADFEDQVDTPSSNDKLYVVTETTVRIERGDLEAAEESVSIPMEPLPAHRLSAASTQVAEQFGFLSRSRPSSQS